MVEYAGWPTFFLLTVAIALPGLLLLRWRRADIERIDGRTDA
jgi:PAT family beta-lactamase induction signal transducer AmpG